MVKSNAVKSNTAKSNTAKSNTSQSKASRPSGWLRFLFDNSLFLIGGAILALVWANLDADSYHATVEIFLGLFGLANAGVVLGNVGAPTVIVLVGLLVGKPLRITLFTWIAEKWFHLEMPEGMTYRHVFTLGTVAGIGFTVALCMSDAAFPDLEFSSDLRDAVKMGALASFFAAVLAFVVARVLRIERLVPSWKSPAMAVETAKTETEKTALDPFP
jgi:hypothetical protein